MDHRVDEPMDERTLTILLPLALQTLTEEGMGLDAAPTVRAAVRDIARMTKVTLGFSSRAWIETIVARCRHDPALAAAVIARLREPGTSVAGRIAERFLTPRS